MDLSIADKCSIRSAMPKAGRQASESHGIILPYEPLVRTRSKLDQQFDVAWAKSLRRRVLWYCSLKIVLSFLGLLWALLLIIEFHQSNLVDSLSETISLTMLIAAWCYAWRHRQSRHSIFALAFWLYITVGIMSLIVSRYGPALDKVFAGNHKIHSGIRHVSEIKTSKAAIAFASGVPWHILLHHLSLCLFLPWNFRQSIRPALVLLSAVTAISLLDVATGKIGLTGLLSPAKAVLAFVPGSLWCWWRFSRSRNYFKLLYESTAYQELQSELGAARRIHEAQWPQMRTKGPLKLYYDYEPMQQIGGDLLFSHPPADTPADRITAVLFDVTGHGVTAALFVNRLVGELERCCGENPDASPHDLVTALNTHVYCTMAKHGMYVTAIAVQIDLKQNLLTYASAGHPDAFMVCENAATQRLASTTSMLGVMEPSMFTSDEVKHRFESGDSIVLYTDGAVEARNAESGQDLGMDGLQSLLEKVRHSTCADWPQLLLSAVGVHRQSPPNDDALIVVVSRELQE